MKFNIKVKLITSFSILILMTGLITSIIGTFMITRGILNEVQEKVRTDLNSAREIFNTRIKEIHNIIHYTTIRASVKRALLKNDRMSLFNLLLIVKEIGKFEILSVTDAKGNVVLRSQNPEVYGDNLAEDQLVKKVLVEKKAVSSPVIIESKELIKEGVVFAYRSNIELVPTPKTVKRDNDLETSGMMLKTAAPVFNEKRELIGVIYGGVLLNRNYELVDRIKDIVYQGEIYNNKDMGSATIFLKDLRISTNVMDNEGQRAIGTSVSEEVYKKVIGEGKQWIDRAFVVNSWYITAYEPILDIDKNIIGMLYVGMIEDKFVDVKWRSLLIFFSVTFFGMFVVLILSNILANRITKPIKNLAEVSKQISEGDFSVKIETKPKDEFGVLENAFNKMAQGLQERDEKLKNETQRQLMRSEKLAALGRMAAGIAHEINNPLTGVLMYGHFLLKRLPEKDQNWEDAKIIVDETTRCRDLIRNLLDFSRDNIPCKELLHIDDVINKAIDIIQNQIYYENITVVKEYSVGLPKISVDVDQIKQVLINLLLNAAEAMNNGGKLILATFYNKTENNIVIKVTDNGPGISEENLDKIFDPFFTTKEIGKGTGLGLAVTYGIIKRHGGKIDVASVEGAGTTFIITFPVENNTDPEEQFINSEIEE